MARPLRIEYPGAIYHVTTRWNARQSIYQDDKDRLRFLEILDDVMIRFNWSCHGMGIYVCGDKQTYRASLHYDQSYSPIIKFCKEENVIMQDPVTLWSDNG